MVELTFFEIMVELFACSPSRCLDTLSHCKQTSFNSSSKTNYKQKTQLFPSPPCRKYLHETKRTRDIIFGAIATILCNQPERIFRGFLFLGRRIFPGFCVTGFSFLIFMGKSAHKNPLGKFPAKSSKMYTAKLTDTSLQRGQAKKTFSENCFLVRLRKVRIAQYGRVCCFSSHQVHETILGINFPWTENPGKIRRRAF